MQPTTPADIAIEPDDAVVEAAPEADVDTRTDTDIDLPEPDPEPLVAATGTDRPVAIVTGARRGTGRAIAIALAEAGFDVAITDLEPSDELEQVAAHLQRLGVRAVSVVGDLADLDSHEALLDTAEAALGPLDCLVNHAGVPLPPVGDLLDVSAESVDRCLQVDVRGTFFLTQAFAKRLTKRPAPPRHRSIVVVTSAETEAAPDAHGAHALGQAALSRLAALFAARLAEADIAVYEVAIDRGQAPSPGADDAARVVATLVAGRLPCATGQRVRVDGPAPGDAD